MAAHASLLEQRVKRLEAFATLAADFTVELRTQLQSLQIRSGEPGSIKQPRAKRNRGRPVGE